MIMPKMPSAEALETIRTSIKDMTDDDLAVLLSVARGETLYRADQARLVLNIGSTYAFKDKNHNIVHAELLRIGPKNCKLLQTKNTYSDGGMVKTIEVNIHWTVHPSFLKVV